MHPHPDGSLAAQRVAVLVDTGSVYHAARQLHRGKLDYRRLLAHVVGGRQLVRAVAYVVRAEGVDMSAFLGALEAQGFELRVKTTRREPEGPVRADSRVSLALDAVAIAPHVDAVALVSGDGDLAELAGPVSAAGARLEVHAFEGSIAERLACAAHVCCPFGEELLLGSE